MIDTHIHILEPDRFSYPWTTGFAALTGRFDLSDYQREANGVDAGVFMEVDCSESAAEARYFCAMAEMPGSLIQSVVAAARPEQDGFHEYLDSISHPRLVGIRRVLHTQPDDVARTDYFRANLEEFGRRGLSFDLCVAERQLPLACELAAGCPGTSMVLDHCGCPDIASHTDADRFRVWEDWIRRIAGLPNVTVKLSGITAYASAEQRNAEALRPYFEVLMEAFGPDRMLWGGDWPVVNLGNGLPAWLEITRDLLEPIDPSDREKILITTARRIYRIP